MRINTNTGANDAFRNLSRVEADVQTSMAKLSSGFRINKAGDDAAGLGIANKLRADIRSLTQASKNAEQANSLLAVAEGGLQTVGKILERMKELATQSASDNTDTGGRVAIQAEFAVLRTEIDAITSTTKFQGKTLLDGSFGNSVNAFSPADIGTGFAAVRISGAAASTYTLTSSAAGTYTLTATSGDAQTITGVASGAGTLDFNGLGIKIETNSAFVNTATPAATTVVTAGAGGGSFMVRSSGDYTGDDNVSLSGLDVDATALGISASSLSTLALSQAALSDIDAAIGVVNTAIGDVGAAQNRINYALENVRAQVTNFSAAESVIRDVDMAEEMTKFSKNQILAQAGTAMLAQANQSAQGVLQLLRG
ncbi:MAG: flagellin [Gemmatimonadetes bacterium]|nr:flagellin [Gemmatimonadota bacterium]